MTREFAVTERTFCPVCNLRQIKNILTHFDDRYGQPDLYDVLQCQSPNCQLAFVRQRISDEELGVLYSKYYHHHEVKPLPKHLDNAMNFMKQLRDLIFNTDNLYNRLGSKQKVLDIGCGYGPSASFPLRKNIDWTGLEIDPNKAALASKNGLNCKPMKLEDFANNSKETFDVILVNQVIEHAKTGINDRDLPVFFIVCLSETRQYHGINGGFMRGVHPGAGRIDSPGFFLFLQGVGRGLFLGVKARIGAYQ